jgi:hypothetical protein
LELNVHIGVISNVFFHLLLIESLMKI